MVTHSSILAWRVPWTEEPGGLQSIESRRITHDCSDLVCKHVHRWGKSRRAKSWVRLQMFAHLGSSLPTQTPAEVIGDYGSHRESIEGHSHFLQGHVQAKHSVCLPELKSFHW